MSKSEKLTRIYEAEGRNTSSNDPKMMEARVFIGNLASDLVTRQDMEKMFNKYGKILGVSLHKSFGFVQFETKEQAEMAVKEEKGNMLKGLKMDMCIATERRKDNSSSGSRSSRRPPRPRSRSPRRRREKEWDRDRDRWPWPRRPSPPPPHRFRGEPPFRDPYFRDDPYFHPRDDPYDRFPPLDPYDRFPPPPLRGYARDMPPLPPPRGRERFDEGWDEGEPYIRERERPRPPSVPPLEETRGGGSSLLPKPETRSTEMEIIVVSQQQKEYGQMVRQQVESLGVLVEMRQLSPTFSLLQALDSAAKRGFLYTIIITSQHESHRSVTLTILHGRNPQEHKNMPLADAIGLIERDYERYRQTVRLTGRPPVARGTGDTSTVGRGPSDNVTGLMSKAATGLEDLSKNEISTLIMALQQKQQQSGGAGMAAQQQETVINSRATTSTEDIQQQQADLQAKILSLLGSSAVVPSPSNNKSTISPRQTQKQQGGGRKSLDSGNSSFTTAAGYGGFTAAGFGGFR